MLARLILLPLALLLMGNAPAPSPWLTLDQLKAKYQDSQSHYATIAGLKVHYKDEGLKGPDAPVLLLVHGSSSTLRTWDGMVPLLKAHYRVIRYDVPGLGLSDDVPDSVVASTAPADIAEALLTQLGIKKVTVVGVSSGGTLGVFLAAKRPDLVERLVLSNAPSDPVDTSHLVLTKAWTDAQARAKAQGYQDADYWSQFLTFFAGDGSRIDQPTRLHFYDFNRRTAHKNFIAMIAKVADAPKARAAMAAVKAPTLLIWGGSDALLPPSAGRTLYGYLANAEPALVYLPDVGHFPPIETPKRFTAIMRAWIEDGVPSRK